MDKSYFLKNTNYPMEASWLNLEICIVYEAQGIPSIAVSISLTRLTGATEALSCGCEHDQSAWEWFKHLPSALYIVSGIQTLSKLL